MLVAVGVAAAAVVAFVAFITLSGSANQDLDAAESTTTVATSSTASTAPDAATTTTTRAPTTTTTTVAPIVLSIGYSIYVPVFQERDDAGNLTGFEVDLVDELTERMGVQAEWIETDLAELYFGTDIGEFDLLVGGLVVLDFTLESIRFTDPYFVRQHGLMVDPDVDTHVTSFDALSSGDAVAVDEATRSAEWAEADLAPSGVEVIAFRSAREVSDALRSGEVDAYVSSAVYPSVAAGRIPTRELVDATPTGQVVAIGVDTDQPDLRAVLNTHLAAMIEDGTYQQIYDRWFQDRSASVAPIGDRAGG